MNILKCFSKRCKETKKFAIDELYYDLQLKIPEIDKRIENLEIRIAEVNLRIREFLVNLKEETRINFRFKLKRFSFKNKWYQSQSTIFNQRN